MESSMGRFILNPCPSLPRTWRIHVPALSGEKWKMPFESVCNVYAGSLSSGGKTRTEAWEKGSPVSNLASILITFSERIVYSDPCEKSGLKVRSRTGRISFFNGLPRNGLLPDVPAFLWRLSAKDRNRDFSYLPGQH